MPEGPSIVILKEEAEPFTKHRILSVTGNTKIEKERLVGQRPVFKSWGKHFLICLDGFTLRVHFLLFGSYRINEQKDRPVRLGIEFDNGVLNFYSTSLRFIEEPLDSIYDWSADVMNETWNPEKAFEKLRQVPNILVCDALLEQDIFAGVGNIIKNEVLYRVRLHPETAVGNIPDEKLRELIGEAKIYSFEFLEWKKKYELKKHWLAHTKKICLRCDLPIIKKYTGTKKRRSFFCDNCQILYDGN